MYHTNILTGADSGRAPPNCCPMGRYPDGCWGDYTKQTSAKQDLTHYDPPGYKIMGSKYKTRVQRRPTYAATQSTRDGTDSEYTQKYIRLCKMFGKNRCHCRSGGNRL